MEKENKVSFPDTSKILSKLKDFQRKTVKYAFKQMYERENPTRRFLIADEVGLGKTLVARGLIARAIDRFKIPIQDGRLRYDIIYICSNTEIAKQNINRLNVIGGVERKEFTFTSRITLLPVELDEIKKNRINFISFTPGTSFNLRSSEGIYEERALIYHLLKEKWNLSYRTKYVKFFQCHAKLEYWEEYLIEDFNKKNKIDTFLANKFLEKLEAKIAQENQNNKENIYVRFEKTAEKFNYLRQSKKVSTDVSRERNRIVGELRVLLAKSCISSLEPDFIILDEFQRFKNLLDGQGEMCKLAREMFDFEDTKLLLLSATPYKMYTLYQEDEIHYDDFIRTAQFLLTNKDDSENSNRDIMSLKTQLEEYKNLLYQMNENNLEDLYKCKRKIEKILGKVMCRTERNSGISKQDNMIKEYTEKVEIEHKEIIDFIKIDKIAQVVKHRNCMEYWKSSPYLLNFMDDDYKLKKECVKGINDCSLKVENALISAKKSFLSWRKISKYGKIPSANHKLKALLKNSMKNESWKLLWIPPSLPYYRSYSFFDNLKDYTKSLIFSSWKVVPKTIASLCSYEAERNAKDFNQEEYGYGGKERRKIKELNFAMSIKEDKPASMNLITLFYPCMTLAKKINPLKITQNYMKENGSLPSAEEMENEIKHQIRNILENTVLRKKLDSEGPFDQRWYWASLIFMDRVFYKDKIKEWFSNDRGKDYNLKNLNKKSDKDVEGDLKQDKKSEPSHFAEHISNLEKFFKLEPHEIVKKLGNPPKDLLSILSKIALASPAVTSLRTLSEYGKYKPVLFYNAALISFGFRSLYILPEIISLIKQLYPDGPYWKKILQYNIAGNLQSLLEEYMYVLFESLGLMNLSDEEKIVCELGEHIEKVVSIRTPSLYLDEIKIKNNKVGETKKRSMRCRFAMRFGTGIKELGQEVSNITEVRNAFNSPFRPFILATTSIGQEGLDFHQYCHSIYHWNLPPNPVDLEQREGRIFRYKGHAIRKNIATKYGKKLLVNHFKSNLWDNLFNIALKERESGANDLIPFWIFDQGKAKIQRHIPAMPMSREKNQKIALSRSLAVYRLVFGQPRQEDLINFINSQVGGDVGGIKIDKILNCRIDLAPK